MHATEELLEVQMLCRASADGNMHIYILYIHGSIDMDDDHHLVEAVWNTVHASYPIEHIL